MDQTDSHWYEAIDENILIDHFDDQGDPNLLGSAKSSKISKSFSGQRSDALNEEKADDLYITTKPRKNTNQDDPKSANNFIKKLTMKMNKRKSKEVIEKQSEGTR